jgi:hypothetical protein
LKRLMPRVREISRAAGGATEPGTATTLDI